MDRSCLRWPVSEGAGAALRRGDVVEVYCRGTSVPGSWLDSVVVRARPPDRFFVEHVDGPVERSRLRLVRRPPRLAWWRLGELRGLAKDTLPEAWVDIAPKAEAALARRARREEARCRPAAGCGAPCVVS